MGVSWCQGSGYVARRKAIMEIGGWPTYSLSEDVLCTMMLIGTHWRTSYMYESLQHGMVPDTWMGHVRQRMRWVRIVHLIWDEMVGVVQPANCTLAVLWGLPKRGNDAILFIRKVECSHDSTATCWWFHDSSHGSQCHGLTGFHHQPTSSPSLWTAYDNVPDAVTATTSPQFGMSDGDQRLDSRPSLLNRPHRLSSILTLARSTSMDESLCVTFQTGYHAIFH
jgi:hypothetical protein